MLHFLQRVFFHCNLNDIFLLKLYIKKALKYSSLKPRNSYFTFKPHILVLLSFLWNKILNVIPSIISSVGTIQPSLFSFSKQVTSAASSNWVVHHHHHHHHHHLTILINNYTKHYLQNYFFTNITNFVNYQTFVHVNYQTVPP